MSPAHGQPAQGVLGHGRKISAMTQKTTNRMASIGHAAFGEGLSPLPRGCYFGSATGGSEWSGCPAPSSTQAHL